MKKTHIKKLDKIWSEKIKELADNKCESCLEGKIWLNSCHIISRRYRATRWGCYIDGKYDLNGFCGCYSCHMAYDQHSPKEAFIRRVVIGEERYQKLGKIAQDISITKTQEFEEIRNILTNLQRYDRM